MKSTLENPLAFFTDYINHGISSDLIKYKQEKKVVRDYANAFSGDHVPFDERTLPFKESNFFTIDEFIKREIEDEVNISKNFIEQGFEKRFSNNNELQSYSKFLNLKLAQLSEIDVTNQLTLILSEFKSFINHYAVSTTKYQFNYSFCLLKKNPSNLYNLLTEKPELIKCSKKDFINAFTSQEVRVKIKWLPISKRNKKPNKTSLIYFIDELINKGFLPSYMVHDVYKHIKYVFLDVNGEEFKHLKQSRQNMSENHDFKNRIDSVISSL